MADRQSDQTPHARSTWIYLCMSDEVLVHLDLQTYCTDWINRPVKLGSICSTWGATWYDLDLRNWVKRLGRWRVRSREPDPEHFYKSVWNSKLRNSKTSQVSYGLPMKSSFTPLVVVGKRMVAVAGDVGDKRWLWCAPAVKGRGRAHGSTTANSCAVPQQRFIVFCREKEEER